MLDHVKIDKKPEKVKVPQSSADNIKYFINQGKFHDENCDFESFGGYISTNTTDFAVLKDISSR